MKRLKYDRHSKNKSAFFYLLLIVVLGFSEGNLAYAAESRAQLHLPWALLNSRFQTAIGANSSTFSVEIPVYVLNADGIQWNLSGLVASGSLGANSSAVTANNVGVRSLGSPLSMTIGRIAVDQIIEKIINGVKVRVHFKASCGPLVLNQSAASFSTLFGLNWSSGSPAASMKVFDVAWPQGSWTASEFSCEGPDGLPQMLHDQILSRLANADDFRPLLGQFLAARVAEKIEETLDRIRQPFGVSSGNSRHTFQIGRFTPIESGVMADVSVVSPLALEQSSPLAVHVNGKTDASEADVASAADIYANLPPDRPAFIGDVALLNQIFQSEIASQSYYFTIDLQANKSFHDLMQSRFLQFFVFADLMNYPKENPFYLQLFRPVFSRLSVLNNGNLRTTFPLSGIVQSYRASQWWTFLTLKGDTQAEVRVSANGGVFTYQTALSNKGVELDYGAQYRSTFKKTGSPPSSIAKSALKGPQPALSGSIVWPVVDLGLGGQYKINNFGWLDSTHFVLEWN